MARPILGRQVVLVGHALHHDLRALRLDYQPVIDTSLLLTYKCALGCRAQSLQLTCICAFLLGPQYDGLQTALWCAELPHRMLTAAGACQTARRRCRTWSAGCWGGSCGSQGSRMM